MSFALQSALKYSKNYFYLRNFFNVFVVGGGTGTISMFLAEQLRHENGEVVYLDFSKHSMDIAKQRAKIRKLNSTTTILLGVHGNMNTVFSQRYDGNCSKIEELNATRIPGDEISKNQYPINEIRSMKRPALFRGISR